MMIISVCSVSSVQVWHINCIFSRLLKSSVYHVVSTEAIVWMCFQSNCIPVHISLVIVTQNEMQHLLNVKHDNQCSHIHTVGSVGIAGRAIIDNNIRNRDSMTSEVYGVSF